MTDGTERNPPTTCVVVSHWVGHSLKITRRLMRQMAKLPAGAPYDMVVVCNGGGLEAGDLPQPPEGVGLTIVNRENQGYNIGAWDAGWRAAPGYDRYLFVQDECVLRRPGWLAAFAARHDAIGAPALIGEAMMWGGLSWEAVTEDTRRKFMPAGAGENPIDSHRALLREMGIDEGDEATHLQSLVLYADGGLLRAMDGLPSRSAYREAVGCEIGISRKAASCGATLAQLNPEARFHVITHPQWVGWGRFMTLVRRRWYRLKGWLKARIGRQQSV